MIHLLNRVTQRCLLSVFSLPALELLEELKAADVRLAVEGDELVVKGHLTDEWRERIKANKSGLVDLVRAGEHLWRPVAEWEFKRVGGRMVGKRLDAPGEQCWPIEPSPEDKVAAIQ